MPFPIAFTRVTTTAASRSLAAVQLMVRSDLASSGVMFSIDTESGFDQVVFITSAWGLGEMVVQGAVNPMSPTSTNRRWRRIAGNRAPYHGVKKIPHGLRAYAGTR
ncbi:PEP/pyruvate-binding domain-containing protein [Escherichia coli]